MVSKLWFGGMTPLVSLVGAAEQDIEMPLNPLSRRTFLTGSAALASVAAGHGMMSALVGAQTKPPTILRPRLTQFELISGKPTTQIFSYTDNAPAPILRAKQHQPFRAQLQNDMPDEPTTIHWHGVRLPIEMDGVPFLTQPYIYQGETFNYAFTPPDAGTYWYHPHCNSLVQTSHGLTGLLIIEEAEDPGFDSDIALNLRDWRLGKDGQFIKLYKPRKTARAGTHGTVRTANWQREPRYDVPTGSLVRLRIANTDVTRIFQLALEGADALVIAVDGNPLPQPLPFDHWVIGSGQRIDLAVLMPGEEGKTVALRNVAANPSWTIATLRAKGASAKRNLRDVRALPPNPIPTPDLKSAETIDFEFTATADQVPKNGFCGTLGYSFWAINRTPWPGVTADPLAPLAELKLGNSYIFSFNNRTPHSHPIHLHGMSFRLLRSNKRKLPPVITATALALPDENIQVAFVADNPGDWLLHCHILEHQKTGMSGFVRVA